MLNLSLFFLLFACNSFGQCHLLFYSGKYTDFSPEIAVVIDMAFKLSPASLFSLFFIIILCV